MPRLSCSVSVRWKMAALALADGLRIRSATCSSLSPLREPSSRAMMLHRHLARHLARRVTTHAVGHDENPAVGDHEVAVLIARPDDADVGADQRR